MDITFDQALVIEKLVAMVDTYWTGWSHHPVSTYDVVTMIRDEVIPRDRSDEEALIIKAERIIENYLDTAITRDSMQDLLDAMDEMEAVSNE